MLRSCLRPNVARWAVWLVIGSCFHAITTPDASAQRLLERLRTRLQPPPAVAPRTPYQTPNATNRARPNPVTPNAASPSSTRGRTLATPIPRSGLVPPVSPQNNTIGSGDVQFGMEVTPRVVGGYQGLWVDGFSAESQADEAGVRPGDLIVSIEGIRTRDLNEAAIALRNLKTTNAADQTVVIQLFRGGQLYQGRVPILDGKRVAAKPPLNNRDAIAQTSSTSDLPRDPTSSQGPTLAKSRASLGIEVRDATPQRGVLVASVPDGTAGAAAGLKEGDRIVSAAGRLVRSTDDLLRELAVLLPGDRLTFGLIRGDVMLERDVEMGEPGGRLARSAVDKTDSKTGTKNVATDSVSTNQSTDNDSAAKPNSGGGLLSGVGSVFGKMLGGNANPAASTLPQPTVAQPSDDSLPMPEPVTEKKDAFEEDPLALPADTSASVETLPMPEPVAAQLPAPKTAEQKVAELEAEIKRLKSQLNDQ